MKRKELARELARTTDLAPGEAQDRVDELVHEILQKLRSGEPLQIERLRKLAARPAGGK